MIEECGNWDRYILWFLLFIFVFVIRWNFVVFKNVLNFYFKCSKEFKVVMGNIEDE